MSLLRFGLLLALSSCGGQNPGDPQGAPSGSGGAEMVAGGGGTAGSSALGGAGGSCREPEPVTCSALDLQSCPKAGESCSVCVTGDCLGGCFGFLQSGWENFSCWRFGSQLLWRSCGKVNQQLTCASFAGLADAGVDVDVCSLPQPDAAGCSGSYRAYWYNAASRACEVMNYGGCRAANEFPFREACEAACAAPPDAG